MYKKYYVVGVLISICLLLLSACGTLTDYGEYVKLHDEEYRKVHLFQEHWVMRGDYRLYAREYGAHQPGPPVVLMHGFPDSLYLYDQVAPQLAQYYNVIVFDFLGWGQSDKPHDHHYNTQSLFEDLNAVMTYFRISQVALVAHDMSGFPAIDRALQNPQQISALILLNTVYTPMSSVKPPEAIALFSTPGLRRSVRRWGARQSDAMWQTGFMEQTAKFYENAEVRERYLKIFAQQALAIRPAFFGLNDVLQDEMRKRESSVSKMSQFTKLVGIIFGAEDPYLNVNVAKEFHSIFPNSSLTLVEGAGHYVQLDKPGAVSASIHKILSTSKTVKSEPIHGEIETEQ